MHTCIYSNKFNHISHFATIFPIIKYMYRKSYGLAGLRVEENSKIFARSPTNGINSIIHSNRIHSATRSQSRALYYSDALWYYYAY